MGAVRDADTVSYASEGGALGVNVNLATGTGTDTYGNVDIYIMIEQVRGTAHDDTLRGGNTANDYYESFAGLAGNDTIDGGSGFDEARYDKDAQYGGMGAVTVDLAAGTATDGFGNTDILINVEAARGTQFADTFIGGAGNDQFSGLAGNDTMNGGAGYNEVRYDRDDAAGGHGAVNVNLAAGTATDGFGDTDTLINIDTVRGTNYADTLTGGNPGNNNAGEFFYGLAGNDTINGAGGYDEVRYDHDVDSGGLAGVTVNLATGTATDGFGDTDTLLNIEAVRGTQFADTLTGGNAAYDSYGEFFQGLAGNDTINGGTGYDEVRYDHDVDFGSHQGVVVNLASGTATDGFGSTDTLLDIEAIRGTQFADTLTGGNVQNDNDGEYFYGLAGNDTIDGGTGYDEVRYDRDAQYGGNFGISVNLAAGTATDGFGNTDTLSNLKGVRGTQFADSLRGNDNNARLLDSLFGLGGNDTLDGGLGLDEARYDKDAQFGATHGVSVNLATGTAVDGFGNTDTLISIEAVRGTNFADTITGSAVANALSGDAGNDTIDGGAGADTMTGGIGNDTYYVDNAGDQVIEAAGGGTDLVRTSVSFALTAGQESSPSPRRTMPAPRPSTSPATPSPTRSTAMPARTS